MYSTCLFCNRPLGRNDVVEHFPVGRRLAYDAGKGRLWVVCRACERWNLTPLDERWEAIEECERLFERTRVRVATEHVGLAKLREGLELVRIGAPLRPEFAAWRYGNQFGRRRRKHLIVAGGVIAAGVAVVGGALAAGIGIVVAGQVGQGLYTTAVHGRSDAIVAHVADGDRVLRVRRRHLRETVVREGHDGDLSFALRHELGTITLSGDVARRAAGVLLRAANRTGGSRDEVEQAAARIERAGSAEAFLHSAGRRAAGISRVVTQSEARSFANVDDAYASGLMALAPSFRLAIEMALHEDSERRAMDGELAELEAAWRGAEEIAAIADTL